MTGPSPDTDNPEIIRLSRLQFRWQESLPSVLAVDDFRVQRGERLFLSGASGTGKSTLLSLLAGVNLPQRGEIQILDRSLEKMSSVQRDHFRADHVGFVFQLFNLIPYLSVLENVTLPCRFSRLRTRRVADSGRSQQQEAIRLLEHLDMNDPQLLSRPVTHLSVGQQQRVAVARALMGSPELVIADEPTSSLDVDRRQAFLQLLFQECEQQGTTLLFVSHDRSLEGLFHRAIQMDQINRLHAEVA
jgi:putative ABC transport system ATP-binding protein